jgi:hypothetical protein
MNSVVKALLSALSDAARCRGVVVLVHRRPTSCAAS